VVTGTNPYRINRGVSGSGYSLEAINISLQPSGEIAFGAVQTGTVSIPQIDYFKLRQSPYARAVTFVDLPSASATVTAVIAGGAASNATHRVVLNDKPYDGVFVLTYTVSSTTATSAAIAYDSTAANLQAILEAMPNIGTGNVSVTKDSSTNPTWTIAFGGTLANITIAAPTANVTGLIMPKGKVGNINLATDEMLGFLGDSNTGVELALFEIEFKPASGKPVTIYQSEITLSEDLIKGELTVPAPRAQYPTLDEIQSQFLALSGGAMVGDIDMDGNEIQNAVIPTHLPISGGNMSGVINMAGNAIVDTSFIGSNSTNKIQEGVDFDDLHINPDGTRLLITAGTFTIDVSNVAAGNLPADWVTFFSVSSANGVNINNKKLSNCTRMSNQHLTQRIHQKGRDRAEKFS
jgi:hypothetical protein